MNDTLTNLAEAWKAATGYLPWGVQRTFLESLKLVEEGKLHMAYSADYSDGNPCLVNANATMLGAIDGEGGTGKPSQFYARVVGAFDQVNREFEKLGYNSNRTVSTDAAGFLVRHFAPLKTVEQANEETKKVDQEPEGYIQLAEDNDLMADWFNTNTSLPATDIVDQKTEEDSHHSSH